MRTPNSVRNTQLERTKTFTAIADPKFKPRTFQSKLFDAK